MSFYIRKASGKKELFNINKFKYSLNKAGAAPEFIEELAKEIENIPGLRTTRDIYYFALDRLHKKNIAVASRYNIKQALLELGPAGFPFERFVEAIFAAQGYQVERDQIARGFCIEHEVDVIALKENKHFLIECKFHNRQGLKCDVKVPLYIKGRFDDIDKAWHQHPSDRKFHEAWIVTNTRFTTEATKFAECVGIKLLSWDYPKDNNIPALIDKLQLHPITALVSLTRNQKHTFIKNGFVLCRDAEKHRELLKQLGMGPAEIESLIKDAQAVCRIKPEK